MEELKYPAHPKNGNKLCKCSECRAYQAYRQRLGRRNQAKLEWGVRVDTGWVDATESRDALKRAKKAGASAREMVRTTGLGEATVYSIVTGGRKTILRKTHNRIQDVYGIAVPRNLTPGQRLPIKEHKWKLQALMAQGWTTTAMRQMLKDHGRDYRWLSTSALKRDYGRWQVKTIREVDWLVEHIGDRHGPSSITRDRMQKKGIFPIIHYSENGRLLVKSLTPEQKETWKRRVR